MGSRLLHLRHHQLKQGNASYRRQFYSQCLKPSFTLVLDLASWKPHRAQVVHFCNHPMPRACFSPCRRRRLPGRATLRMPQYLFGSLEEWKLKSVWWCLRSGFTLFSHFQAQINRCRCLLPTSPGRSCHIRRALRSRLKTMRMWLRSKSWLFAHPSSIQSSSAHARCYHVGRSRVQKSQR